MREKMPKSAGAGLFMLFCIALGVYFNQGNSSEEDPEVAEEAALGQTNSSPESILDEELSGAQDFYATSSSHSMSDDEQLGSPLEIPRGGRTHGLVVEHTGYTLSYDTINHNPFWVAWELTRQESKGKVGRADTFMEDPSIPSRHAVRPATYSGSGYSRGHMCPAGDQKWSTDAMDDSFYMSNMCPQTFELNKLWWDWLERAERQWAREEGSVYIVCGPIYDSNRPVKNLNKKKNFFVGIPHKFFKVILSTRSGNEKALGFVYRNDASEQTLEECLCSVDQIEQLTGFDFFSQLDDKIENHIEAESNLLDWGNVPQPQWDE